MTDNANKKRPFIALDIYSHGSIVVLKNENNEKVPALIDYESMNIHSIVKIGHTAPGCKSIGLHTKYNELMNPMQEYLDTMTEPCDVIHFLEMYVDSSLKNNYTIKKIEKTCPEKSEKMISNLMKRFEKLGLDQKGEDITQEFNLRKNIFSTKHTIFQYNRDDIYPRQGLYNKIFTTFDDPNMNGCMYYLQTKGYPIKSHVDANGKQTFFIFLSDILQHISDNYPDADVYIIDRSCNRFGSTTPIDNIAPSTVINGGRNKQIFTPFFIQNVKSWPTFTLKNRCILNEKFGKKRRRNNKKTKKRKNKY